MKLVREILYEKFSEDIDPVHAMGIGEIPVEDIMKQILAVDKKHKNKIRYIDARFSERLEFVLNAKQISKLHVRYLKKIIEEAGYLDFFETVKRDNDNYTILFNIRDQYRKIIVNGDYRKRTRQLNEKFEEESDPVKDLGIGETVEFEKTFYDFIYSGFEGFYSILDKIIAKGSIITIEWSHDPYEDNFKNSIKSSIRKSGFEKYVNDIDSVVRSKKSQFRDEVAIPIKQQYWHIIEGIESVDKKYVTTALNFKDKTGHTYEIKINWKK